MKNSSTMNKAASSLSIFDCMMKPLISFKKTAPCRYDKEQCMEASNKSMISTVRRVASLFLLSILLWRRVRCLRRALLISYGNRHSRGPNDPVPLRV